MHDTTAIASSQAAPAQRAPTAYSRGSRYAEFHRHYPSVDYLRRRARWRVPGFAFDFVDGGANDEVCVARNIAAFRSIELLPLPANHSVPCWPIRRDLRRPMPMEHLRCNARGQSLTLQDVQAPPTDGTSMATCAIPGCRR